MTKHTLGMTAAEAPSSTGVWETGMYMERHDDRWISGDGEVIQSHKEGECRHIDLM